MPNFIVWGRKYLERHPGTPRTERVTQADELEKLRWTPERNTEDNRKPSPSAANSHQLEQETTPAVATTAPSWHYYRGKAGGRFDGNVEFTPATKAVLDAGTPAFTAWWSDRIPTKLHVWSRAEKPAHWWKGATFRCPVCECKMELDGEPQKGHNGVFTCPTCEIYHGGFNRENY